jgi:acyl-CoA thioesterase FadM
VSWGRHDWSLAYERFTGRGGRTFSRKHSGRPTTDRIVATSRVVMASVDAEMGRAAPIPTALWDAIESFEGRTVETVESSHRPI